MMGTGTECDEEEFPLLLPLLLGTLEAFDEVDVEVEFDGSAITAVYIA